MFAVLRVEKEQASSIFGKLLHRMKQHRIRAETVETPLGSFLLLTAASERIDWDKAAALCGRAGKNLVLPRELALPENAPVRRFVPVSFSLLLLKNTSVELIRRCKLPLYRKIVTLVDPQALYLDFVPELLCYCITVRVVTARPERYAALSEQLMEELGASIVVTDEPDSLGGSVLVICPDSGDVGGLSAAVPVLTAGDADAPSQSRFVVGDPQLRPRGELAACLPHGISPLDFAGALYQFGGWRGAEKLTASTLRCKSNLLTPAELAEYVAKRG